MSWYAIQVASIGAVLWETPPYPFACDKASVWANGECVGRKRALGGQSGTARPHELSEWREPRDTLTGVQKLRAATPSDASEGLAGSSGAGRRRKNLLSAQLRSSYYTHQQKHLTEPKAGISLDVIQLTV